MMNQVPCPFLIENRCSVYPVRPLVFKMYLFQPSPTKFVIEATDICPIPALLSSELKETYNGIILKRKMFINIANKDITVCNKLFYNKHYNF
jgi:Fe-S-cluster containining protein